MPGLLSTAVPPASSFALVDDVAGAGAGLERCTELLRGMGHHVAGAWVIVDRHDGTAYRLARLDVPLHTLLTIQQIGSAAPPPGRAGAASSGTKARTEVAP
ncbi:hypothetical protein [Streptomyces sp. NPDC048428]|uniref:hypothetical protein n=1 Tax=Streptomyces sp. NPDC048428 TaxID=3154503 RepID=UPI00341E5AC2